MINGTEWLVFIGWEDQVGSIITPRWTMWRSSPNPIGGVRCLFVQCFLTISHLFSMFTNLKYINTILPAIFCHATPWCYFYETLFWEQNSQPLQCLNSKTAPNKKGPRPSLGFARLLIQPLIGSAGYSSLQKPNKMALMASWQCLGVENDSRVDKALETAWCRYNGAHGCI